MSPAILRHWRSGNRTIRLGFVLLDTSVLKDWSLQALTVRLIAIGALTLLSVVTVPLFTQGQVQPQTNEQYEIQELQHKFSKFEDKYDDVPLKLALLALEVKSVAAAQQRQADLTEKAMMGIIGMCITGILAGLKWLLGSMGITANFGKRGGTA